jgi:cell division protein FtsX
MQETVEKSNRALVVFAIAAAALIAGVIFYVVLQSKDSTLSQAEVAARSQAIQWQDGSLVSIFMKPDATPQQVADVQTELGKRSDVTSFRYLDKPAAYTEAQQMFAGDEKILSDLKVETMPTSYRVIPTSADAVVILGDQFKALPGVSTVTYARDAQAAIDRAK